MKLSCTLLILLFSANAYFGLYGQGIAGQISDEKGHPLAFVNVYIKGTTKGTASNIDGLYELKLSPGKYEIIYQYIGYEQKSTQIEINDLSIKKDIILSPQSLLLQEVVIAADREDPAYAIIRQAIAKRAYYKDKLTTYTCDVYVKGNQKILDAPDKILGQEVGDLDGMLDSSRQGIVYLSESVSQLYKDGKEFKEIISSSKISGDDRGYSFNSAREMEFEFYANNLDLQRQMISPIADNALNYYKYRLDGVFQDDTGHLVNKISVMQKRDTDPTFFGTIYITDKLWNIHSLNLVASGAATQIFFIDSLTFNQIFVPVDDQDSWALISNTISFKISALGFKLRGLFASVYSNYNFDPKFEKDFFDENVHVVTAESNKRDSVYWSEIRPIPLTVEEQVDYHVKDSIFEVRNDPIYMDSVDRLSNKFKFGNLFSGYNYTRRTKQYYASISNPLNGIQYNTVQGYNLELDFDFRKYFDEEETRRLLFGAQANYGLSENKFRLNGYLTYRPSRLNYSQIRIRGGSDIAQFNSAEPISPFLNTYYSLLLRRNHAKYLGLNFLNIDGQFEPWTGIFISPGIRWEERIPLSNNSTFSYFRRNAEEGFTSNDPLDPTNTESLFFDRHQALLVDLNFTFRFGQKYFLYPDRRWIGENKGPRLRLSYTGAFAVGGTDISYQKIAASLHDEWNVGVGGRFEWYLNGGFFFNVNEISFRDFRHFLGSEIFILKNGNYSSSFLQLPFYSFSTSDKYLQAHIQHHFDGFILDKIPGIRKLGWSLAAGAKLLAVGGRDPYYELHMGLDNIGYKVVRLLRIDAVWSHSDEGSQWGARMSIGLN